MKKTITLCVALCATVAVYAQRQLATLNHNDSISVYYGENALSTALGASVNGDIITLSPGIFNGAIITKAVTIRGAGMYTDTSSGEYATTISGSASTTSMSVDVQEDTNNLLIIEGLYVIGKVAIGRAYNPLFLKCYFAGNIEGMDSAILSNAIVINCIISNWGTNNISTITREQGTLFQNSVVLSPAIDPYYNRTLINSIAQVSPTSWTGLTAINSIVYSPVNSCGGGSVLPYNAYNCIGIYQQATNCWGAFHYFGENYTGQMTEHNIHNINYRYSVFRSYLESYPGYHHWTYFALQDSIATNYLGDDSTQIGIYGGLYPFNPRVTNPHIIRCNVARRATADGRLPVDIEIVNE